MSNRWVRVVRSFTPRVWGNRARATVSGVMAGLVTAVALVVTSPTAPMVWDEGDAIYRAERVRKWFGQVFSEGNPWAAFTVQAIRQGWPFATQREGHPAGYGVLIALGKSAAFWLHDPLTQYRYGPMLLFSLATGAAVYRLYRTWGIRAALAGWFCLILQPRLFAHAHFASYDGPVTAWWLLAWVTFPLTATRTQWQGKAAASSPLGRFLVWGMVLGATLSTKATGWLAPLPFLAWTICYRRWRSLPKLFLGLLTAGITFLVLNPPLWVSPIAGWGKFFALNLHRRATPGLNITTCFLGRFYNLDYPLPWYNTLFWTAIVVPLPILFCFLLGLIQWVRTRRRADLTLLLLNWATLVMVRAIPGTPPHDGIRLFLPSFAFLGLIAGVGFRWGTVRLTRALRSWTEWPSVLRQQAIRRQAANRRYGIGQVAGKAHPAMPPRSTEQAAPSELPPSASRTSAAILPNLPKHLGQDVRAVPCSTTIKRLRTGIRCGEFFAWLLILLTAFNLVCYAPQWLSYYNELIGGLSGAEQAGMEATYYWDGLDRDVLQWLDLHCLAGDKVYFSACSLANLQLLKRWGCFRFEVTLSPGEARWYVIQNRPSAWPPEDRWLFLQGKPAYTKYAGQGWCPCIGRVPVVKVFSLQEYFHAVRQTKDTSSGNRS